MSDPQADLMKLFEAVDLEGEEEVLDEDLVGWTAATLATLKDLSVNWSDEAASESLDAIKEINNMFGGPRSEMMSDEQQAHEAVVRILIVNATTIVTLINHVTSFILPLADRGLTVANSKAVFTAAIKHPWFTEIPSGVAEAITAGATLTPSLPWTLFEMITMIIDKSKVHEGVCNGDS